VDSVLPLVMMSAIRATTWHLSAATSRRSPMSLPRSYSSIGQWEAGCGFLLSRRHGILANDQGHEIVGAAGHAGQGGRRLVRSETENSPGSGEACLVGSYATIAG